MSNNILYAIGKHISRNLFELLYNAEAFGLENVPEEGGFLLASNHLSFFDPFIAGAFMYRNIHFFARSTLFKNGMSSYILKQWNAIPVKRGAGDIQAIKAVVSLLNSGAGVLVFPEGTRSDEESESLPKRGVGLMAVKTRVPVVPMRIFGVENIWKKGNAIPLFSGTISVVYGKRLDPEDYLCDVEDPYQEASNRIMKAIRDLSVSVEP